MPRGRTKNHLETPETNTKKETATEPRQKKVQTGSTDSRGRVGRTDARHVTYVRRHPINTANVVNATY